MPDLNFSRKTKNERELEAAIVAQGVIAQTFYRVGSREQAVVAFRLMRELIARRSPEMVARMEAQKGLV